MSFTRPPESRAKDILNKLSEDVSSLKADISSLFSHQTGTELQKSARNLADIGKDRLDSHLKYIRTHPGQSSAGIFGGLVLLGAVGVGIYYLCKSDCCNKDSGYIDHSDIDEEKSRGELPPYIS